MRVVDVLIFIALLGVKGVWEMINSYRAPSSLNMGSHRAIWTPFRPNSMIFILQTHFKWLASGIGSR